MASNYNLVTRPAVVAVSDGASRSCCAPRRSRTCSPPIRGWRENLGLMTESLKVALLGGGTVGSQVARLMASTGHHLAARAGAPLELVGVAVRDTSRHRDGIDDELLTDDPAALVARPDVDIVVEVMGGMDPTYDLLLDAMAHGSSWSRPTRR